jgi:four helix bundle protein
VAGVRNPEELDVWKLSDELERRVEKIIGREGFRRHESLRGQMERASESPCSNIEEGFSRYLPADNARFVRIATGSLRELIRHLNRALRRQLISQAEHVELTTLARRAGGAAARYIVYLQTAKPPHLKTPRRDNRPRENQEPEP